jgi:hypothetical protein
MSKLTINKNNKYHRSSKKTENHDHISRCKESKDSIEVKKKFCDTCKRIKECHLYSFNEWCKKLFCKNHESHTHYFCDTCYTWYFKVPE